MTSGQLVNKPIKKCAVVTPSDDPIKLFPLIEIRVGAWENLLQSTSIGFLCDFHDFKPFRILSINCTSTTELNVGMSINYFYTLFRLPMIIIFSFRRQSSSRSLKTFVYRIINELELRWWISEELHWLPDTGSIEIASPNSFGESMIVARLTLDGVVTKSLEDD